MPLNQDIITGMHADIAEAVKDSLDVLLFGRDVIEGTASPVMVNEDSSEEGAVVWSGMEFVAPRLNIKRIPSRGERVVLNGAAAWVENVVLDDAAVTITLRGGRND